MTDIIISNFALAALFLALGGLIKGATGAGAPVLAIPALAMLYDVKFAVAIMMVPNLLTNIWQLRQYRQHLLPDQFVWSFAISGAAGALVGSWFLATLSPSALSLIVAFGVFAYVAFRLLRSTWVLEYASALKICIPVGLVAGTLQGASGISAPISLSFFNAMRLERATFISSISVYFIAMTLVQIPALMALGIMRTEHFFSGALALLPIVLFMPIGQALAQKFSRNTFDRIMLILLLCLAIKLVIDSW